MHVSHFCPISPAPFCGYPHQPFFVPSIFPYHLYTAFKTPVFTLISVSEFPEFVYIYFCAFNYIYLHIKGNDPIDRLTDCCLAQTPEPTNIQFGEYISLP